MDGMALAGFMRAHRLSGVAIEKVGAMPKQGVNSMFSFGHSAGVAEGVARALGLSVVMISPADWKRRYAFSGEGKDAPRQALIREGCSDPLLDYVGKGQAIADAAFVCRAALAGGFFLGNNRAY